MSMDNTIELVSLALDAAIMRQTAIANNVANSNTRGYQTQEVNFEQQLKNLPMETNEALSDLVKPYYEACETQSSIDEQLALGVKNATQFRALIKGLNHKLAIMKMALEGNHSS